MKFRRTTRNEQGTALAPLLDVVLLLLIFFVVTSSFAERQIPLDLPSAEAGETAPNEALVVNVDASGGIVVRDETPDDATLRALFDEAKRDDAAVELRADRETRHADVMRILDLATQVGVERLGIAVGQGEGPAAAADQSAAR